MGLYRILLLIALTSALILFISQYDAGYIYIRYMNWHVESTLTFTLIVFAILLFVLFFFHSIVGVTFKLPRRFSRWRQHRNMLKVQRSTNAGLVALAEGHWERAEKQFSRHAQLSGSPLINYLGAAQAAQRLGADKRRDEYLAAAHRSMPEAELAIGLTQADVQFSHGQIEKALATLKHLSTIAPKHKYVLYLLKKCCEQLKSWDDLVELLPRLHQQKVFNTEQLNQLEEKVYFEILIAADDRIDHLHQAWNRIPQQLRQQPKFLGKYASELASLGAVSESETILRNHLKNNWSPDLIRLYGLVSGDDLMLQLNAAEQWLKEYHRHPELNLALGRIALKNKLWGKAKGYLEMSISAEPREESYCELGNLLEFMNEDEAAADCFAKGLRLAAKGKCSPLNPYTAS